jgi:hypothetical protein
MQSADSMLTATVPESPISRAEIDPLTRYVERYRTDPVMQSYVQKATLQRAALCDRVADFYRHQSLTQQQITVISGEYSYSCPFMVADLIASRESSIERAYQTR